MKNFMEEYVEGNFMKKGIAVSGSKEKLCVLVQSVFLLGFQSGIADYDHVTKKNCKEIAEEIVGRYSEEQKRRLWDVIDYLGDAGFRRHSFLTEENVPFVIACARWALIRDKSPESFRTLVDQWQKEKRTISRLTNREEKMQQLKNSMKSYYGMR